MNWLTSGLQAAQEAASTLVSSETAEKARQLAQEASRQALAFAQEASVKAQEVAKEAQVVASSVAREAMSEAEKGITAIKAVASQSSDPSDSVDPLAYGITLELQQFVASLTYITFSDYPMETLPTPEEAGNIQGRLSAWQETHARLILQKVPQLQDLRFVLCPRKLHEYEFWMIYFTLCRRYLPKAAFEAGAPGGPTAAMAGAGGAAAAAAPAQAAAASPAAGGGMGAVGGGSSSNLSRGAAAAAGVAAGAAAGAAAADKHSDGSDALEDLAADPELDAYLQEALAVGGGSDEGAEGAGTDEGDLDDYINALDAEGDEETK